MSLLISCEVGGRRVPSWLVDSGSLDSVATIGQPWELTTSDAAARYVARRMRDQLGAPLIENPFLHALIDVTRSLRHRRLFSSKQRGWPDAWKQRLIGEIYEPYRGSLRRNLETGLARHAYVVHLSIRTFAGTRDGKPRRTDLGLLYDPGVREEVGFCLEWIDELLVDAPMLRVRRNYPWRGTTDSVTKALRNEFSDQNYLGIEVLLNRAWAARNLLRRDEVIDGLCQSLQQMLGLCRTEAA